MSFRLMMTALALTALVGGCARMTPTTAPAGHVRLVLPTEGWTQVGRIEPVTVPSGSGEAPAQRQVMALRGPQGEWLAAAVLTATRPQTWVPPDRAPMCTASRADQVERTDATGPTRIDCLRFRQFANDMDWLRKQHPETAQALQAAQVTPKAPYAWASHTYTTDSGIYIRLDVAVDHRLVVPPTRNAFEFMAAGHPFETWTRELGKGVRASAGMLDGHLIVPPFPLPLTPQPTQSTPPRP